MTTPSKSAEWHIRHARQIMNYLGAVATVMILLAVWAAVKGDRVGIYAFGGAGVFLLLCLVAARMVARRRGVSEVSQ